MFVGIQFSEEEGGNVAIVHENWLSPKKTNVWWPSYKKQNQFAQSLKDGESPDEKNWTLYKVSRKFFCEEDYSKSLSKIRQAEFTSDINSDDDSKKKRKILKPKRFIISTSDEGTDEDGNSDLVVPPKVKGIQELLKKSFADNKQTSKSSPLLPNTPKSSRVDVSTSTINTSEVQPIGESADYKKILQHLVLIKNQNSEIIHLLKSNATVANTLVNFPEDVPVNLPVNNLQQLQEFERYLSEITHFNSMVTYLSALGGHDVVSKTNLILKKLLSNIVASQYSFLGSRNNKKKFEDLNVHKLIVGAVLTKCSSSSTTDVDNAVKVWLKHAPKRLAAVQKRNDTV